MGSKKLIYVTVFGALFFASFLSSAQGTLRDLNGNARPSGSMTIGALEPIGGQVVVEIPTGMGLSKVAK